jgi:hypothetical protein
MDRVRDLVAAGGVYVVLAQDRDRFAREPAYHYLLRREFEEHGTKIRALNDRGDDSPEGELTDGILDQLAKYERAKIAERSRRGKLRKAREGKLIASPTPDYGFDYNGARDNYVVDEEKMQVVRRIFRMVGAEGESLNSVKKTFDREGVPTPMGSRYWGATFIKRVITDDVYRPHAFEEVKALVSPEVASRLDPDERYGVWWFNRRRRTEKQVSEVASDGRRRYVRRSTTIQKPERCQLERCSPGRCQTERCRLEQCRLEQCRLERGRLEQGRPESCKGNEQRGVRTRDLLPRRCHHARRTTSQVRYDRVRTHAIVQHQRKLVG